MGVRSHWKTSVSSIYQSSFKPGREVSFGFVCHASLAEFSPLPPVMCWDNIITKLPWGTVKPFPFWSSSVSWHSLKAWLTLRTHSSDTAAVMGGRKGSEVACGQAPPLLLFCCSSCLGLSNLISQHKHWHNSRAMLRWDSASGLYRHCGL